MGRNSAVPPISPGDLEKYKPEPFYLPSPPERTAPPGGSSVGAQMSAAADTETFRPISLPPSLPYPGEGHLDDDEYVTVVGPSTWENEKPMLR